MSKPTETQTCAHCGQALPTVEFTFHRYNLHELSAWCRNCREKFANLYEESEEGQAEMKSREGAQIKGSKPKRGKAKAPRNVRDEVLNRPGVRKHQNRVGISGSDKK
jgi:hypothetical protein